tara:strand:+ start:303 stop:530 length:228 start_codon:yes stop_codon:yes gene_type:complete
MNEEDTYKWGSNTETLFKRIGVRFNITFNSGNKEATEYIGTLSGVSHSSNMTLLYFNENELILPLKEVIFMEEFK